ncbi:HD domain-containing phosphohydrolase [Parahaliea mediterranea]|uniref:Transporter substrate-binding domain-containing protein n=1 Tax=Parahaliea mediterranea TaxID=651086 RepID=A0A939DIL6_9GAMM|nr:HD domain-containing phosphohydrolase [Parahaliea mediterranea]MBN7798521.1 transporter substrate-binding domain-containing protein [Parahaliea mediterranea]
MKLTLGKFSITIRMTVVLIFMLATMFTAVLAIGLQYYFSRNLAREVTQEAFTLAASGIAAELASFAASNASAVSLLADNPTLFESGDERAVLQAFAEVLAVNPLLYGAYVGKSDGSLLELVNLDSSVSVRDVHAAAPDDKWLVISTHRGNSSSVRRFRYLDQDFKLRASREEATAYDVRSRHWYLSAMASAGLQHSDVYLFDQLGVPGSTLSRRVRDTTSVVAVDYTLSGVSRWLREQARAHGGDIYIFHPGGMVAAASTQHSRVNDRPVAERLPLNATERALVAAHSPLKVSNELDWPPFDYALSGRPRGYSIDVLRLVGDMTGLELEFVNGFTWPELVQRFRAGDIDLLHSVLLTESNAHWGAASEAYFRLPYAVVTLPGADPVRNLKDLGVMQLAIPAGWSVALLVRRRFPDVEVIEVDNSLAALRAVHDGEVAAALDNEAIFRYIEHHYFLDGYQYHSGVSLGDGPVPDKLHILVQPSRQDLLPLINRAIGAITPNMRDSLRQRWLEHAVTRNPEHAGVVPHNAMITIAGTPERQGKLVEVTHGGKPHFVFVTPTADHGDALLFGVLVPKATVFAPYLEKVRLSIWLTGGAMFALLPLCWVFASPIVTPIKELVGENDKIRLRDYNQVNRIRSRAREIDELSESMVHMVHAIQAHEQAQRELMDAFIRLIAQAIDDKSPYTGGHCERVPELALMLAEQASDSDHPAFHDFRLDGKEQWREFRIAAWLHDCGKITTPEHVVDKGSKLETIYNRIHEIRTRFEVLWRDAEIRYLRQCQADPEAEPRHRQALEQQRARLRDDFAFVAECNVGGEYLGPEKQQRLREIAGITWQRHFDDRVGLSPVEELRQDGGSAPLPATEHLLADKPEHIIPRTRSTDYPPEYGIDMDIPEHLYNQGEIYNLSISRGTLTAEDRFKINEHMISTIKMLESLPFPDELKNVPRYASTHHETMKGTGYPRKLPGAELSIPERLLAVADVFEALTAADRPYKKAKPVSVAVDILFRMVEDNHIDRDSFELFVREKVYLRYAERYLAAEQIDSVDEEKYLSRAQ